MADVQICLTENGPLKVSGPIEITDHEGNTVSPPGDPVFLCRCGGSTNKPFCDGTQSKIGFQGAAQAVAESEQGHR